MPAPRWSGTAAWQHGEAGSGGGVGAMLAAASRRGWHGHGRQAGASRHPKTTELHPTWGPTRASVNFAVL